MWALPWTPSWDVSWELAWGVLGGLKTGKINPCGPWVLSWTLSWGHSRVKFRFRLFCALPGIRPGEGSTVQWTRSLPSPGSQSTKQGDAKGANEVRHRTSSIHFHSGRPVILGMYESFLKCLFEFTVRPLQKVPVRRSQVAEKSMFSKCGDFRAFFIPFFVPLFPLLLQLPRLPTEPRIRNPQKSI